MMILDGNDAIFNVAIILNSNKGEDAKLSYSDYWKLTGGDIWHYE